MAGFENLGTLLIKRLEILNYGYIHLDEQLENLF